MTIKLLHSFPIHKSKYKACANEVIVVVDFSEDRNPTFRKNTNKITFLYPFPPEVILEGTRYSTRDYILRRFTKLKFVTWNPQDTF
jgi:hypothetical protein